MGEQKRCPKCKAEKPHSDFYSIKNGRLTGWCKKCMVKYIGEYNRKRRQTRKRDKVCRSCGNPTIPNSSHFCEFHYVASKLRYAVGTKCNDYTQIMLDRLKQQDYKCPYTGEQIILGINAHLDHIKPKSRFPELATDLNNIEWVSAVINHAKADMTKEEFLSQYRITYIGNPN